MAKPTQGAKKAAAKKTNDQTFTVIQDTREKTPWSFSSSKLVTDIIVDKLDTGDYTVLGYTDLLAIERKASTSEIANNFTEDRWKNVLERLQNYKYRFIICEFDFATVLDFPYNSGIPMSKIQYVKLTPNFLISCLYKIEVDYSIPIIYAGSKQGGELIAENIMKRIVKIESAS